jgi:hypothetical protein
VDGACAIVQMPLIVKSISFAHFQTAPDLELDDAHRAYLAEALERAPPWAWK